MVPDRSARAGRSLVSVVLVYAAGSGHHLITYFQAVVIGLLQGITELFPISSLGHAVILPKLLGWHLSQKQPYFLAFLVATHLATAIVLFLFFLPEWQRILRGLGRSLRDREISPGDADARLAWRPVPHLELSIVGQNLLQPHHAEYGGDPGPLVGIKRGVYASMTWRR